MFFVQCLHTVFVLHSTHPPSLLPSFTTHSGNFRQKSVSYLGARARGEGCFSWRQVTPDADICPLVVFDVQQPLPSQSSGELSELGVGPLPADLQGQTCNVNQGKEDILGKRGHFWLVVSNSKGCLQVPTWFKVRVKVRVRHSFMMELEAGEQVCICSCICVCVCVCCDLSHCLIAAACCRESYLSVFQCR